MRLQYRYIGTYIFNLTFENLKNLFFKFIIVYIFIVLNLKGWTIKKYQGKCPCYRRSYYNQPIFLIFQFYFFKFYNIERWIYNLES